MVREGLKLDFESAPRLFKRKKVRLWKTEDQALIDEAVQDFLEKDAIEETTESEKTFISEIFVIKQKNEKKRAVLDARALNRHLRYAHFKMDNIRVVREAIRKKDWLIKIDIKDAYLHIPVHRKDRNWLTFRWRNKLFRFKAMPFGISSAPRIFTKLIRAALAPLRERGIRILAYLDDFCLLASSKEEALKVARVVREHLERLGFILNESKCNWVPTRVQEFLGFELDTELMEIRLPLSKLRRVRKEARRILNSQNLSARKLASAIGLFNATAEAVFPARLKFRALLRDLQQSLNKEKDNWEAQVHLSGEAKTELGWWLGELERWNGRAMLTPSPTVEVETDASDSGWGIAIRNSSFRTFGHWSAQERNQSINYRELLAVLFAVQLKEREWQDCCVRIWTDNISARAYVNHQGGTASELLNGLAKKIWEIC